MAGNQREIERRERREKKDKRNKIIIWIIIAVIVLVLIVMKVFEININSIKNHFTDENGNFTLTQGVTEDNFPYNLDASQNVKVVNINNKLGVLTPNSFTVLDSKSGTADYLFEHGYSNPILATSGIYSLVYDQGAKNYRLDTVSQAEYEEETENSILCADVSKNGTVAIATASKEKLCDILVYSKSLQLLFSYSISYGYVVDIAISDNSKNISVAVANSENANLVTTVYSYSVSGDGSDELSAVLPSGVLADIEYAGSRLWAVGDSYLGVVKKGEYTEVYEQGAISTKCFSINQSGELVMAYGKYSNSTDCVLSYVRPSGKIKNEIEVSSNVKSISATTSLVTALTSDEIISYNIKNGEEKERITSSDSAKTVCRLGSNVFVHKQSVIDKSEELN
ncbi:MAG: DUF5711 family protein [Clostridium sp.]|nr:DUF5711 family protein [Clostridium sp.]